MSQSLDTPRQWLALSGCYFFFFALLGLIVPYFSTYLAQLNFSSSEIGELLAILMATRIVVPLLSASYIDKTEQRLSAVRWAAALSIVFFCGFYYATSYWEIALVLVLYASCWSAMLPQMEVITLTTLANRSHDYSKVRLWGSIGFIVLVVSGGFIFESFGIDWIISLGVLVLLGLLFTTKFMNYSAPQHHGKTESNTSFYARLKERNMVLFLFSVLLLQISHGPYYSFFVLYLLDYGYTESFSGIQVALGVCAEVVVFTVTATLLRRIGAKRLLFVSMLFSVLRWWLMPLVVENATLLSLSQLLHAASFGSAHAAAMAMLHYWFKGNSQGRGQAVYASISFGVGGVLGALFSGYAWQQGSGAALTWIIAGLIALLASVLVSLIQYPQQRDNTT